jgi:tetratricopeptide (TPR) repeat protein
VFSNSALIAVVLALGLAATSGCASSPVPADGGVAAPQVFYTVTGEIALARREPRVAALQYVAAAAGGTDPTLLARASEVTMESLQPSLTAAVAARWISLDPGSGDAHRAAARAALALQRITKAADEYRIVITGSPRGVEAELGDLDAELANAGNLFGARQVADRLAAAFPGSAAALRLQGFAAMRADDPAAAVKSFNAALALAPTGNTPDGDAGRELMVGLWRARILSGDSAAPLAESQALAERETTPANLLDYALLLLAAQQTEAASAELESLTAEANTAPVALRLLGLIEFQDNELDAAGRHFTDLLGTGKFLDDAFYYLGLIAERHGDVEKALRLYAQVQGGDNSVAALIRASSILQAHGAAPAAQELIEHLLDDEPQRAPEVLAARARIYVDTGDAQQAIEVLGRGAAEYPDSVDIRYAIATTYEEQGRVKAALRELKAVLKDRPDDPAAMNAYGYTLADHNRELAHARALIERAYAAAPRNAAILDSLGWVLYRQGHQDQALPYLSQAYADDRGADIGAHLGEVLWQLGRHADAEKIWTEASAVEADNRVLNATRQRLQATQ